MAREAFGMRQFQVGKAMDCSLIDCSDGLRCIVEVGRDRPTRGLLTHPNMR